MTVNKFADMSASEYKKMLNPKLRNKRSTTHSTLKLSETNVQANPTSLDWRNLNGTSYVNPVKDQGQCGSCWAFAAVGSLESIYAINFNDTLFSLSEQELVSCATGDWGNNGCGGGENYLAFNYTIYNGLRNETDYPYTAKDSNCSNTNATEPALLNGTVTNYTNVVANKSIELITAVHTKGPIAVSIEADTIPF